MRRSALRRTALSQRYTRTYTKATAKAIRRARSTKRRREPLYQQALRNAAQQSEEIGRFERALDGIEEQISEFKATMSRLQNGMDEISQIVQRGRVQLEANGARLDALEERLENRRA